MKADNSSLTALPNVSPSVSNEEGGLELGQLVSGIRRKLWLVAGCAVVVASLAYLKALNDKPVYSSGFEILTKSVTAESEVISSVPQTLTSRQQSQGGAGEAIDETKIRVLQSPNLLYPVVEKLRESYPEITYATVVESLTITPTGPTILAVSYTHGDPRLVKDVLEAVSERYLDYSLEERQKDIRQGLKFVEEQLPPLEERVAKQQEQLEQFRQSYNLIDPQSQAQILSAQASTLAQQMLDTQTQLKQARSLYIEIQAELAKQPAELAASSALSQSPRYQKLLDQLLDTDSKLAQESALYLEASPEVQVLQEQRRNLEPLLRREGERVERAVISNIRELENKGLAVSQSIADVNQRIKILSTVTRQYNNIQRELEIATTNLNQFLAKREGLRIDAAQRQVPWQLLTPPGDPVPSSANVKRSLILGIVLGALLGVGAALMLDRLSNVISSSKQVRKITRLPLLGTIPLEQALSELPWMSKLIRLPRVNPSESKTLNGSGGMFYATPFQEAFRALNASIRLLNPDAPVRSITISSPAPGNGKTTISGYLALTAAAMGQRVLAVDVDLRRSRLHQQFDIPNQVGLTDVISSNAKLWDAIQPISTEPNLFVLTAGTLPPDPTKVLASKAMQGLIRDLENEFDLVIYDTPPLLGFADVYLLASQTDGLLLVVRLNQLKQLLLEQAMEQLRMSKTPLIGAVVNAAEEEAFMTYSYQYSYFEDPVSKQNKFPFIGPVLERQSQRLKALLANLQNRS